MEKSYLEVTYRHGRPIAAYYFLPRRPDQKSYRTKRVDHGMLIDFSRNGKPIGIEITAPAMISLAGFNRILRSLGQAPITRADFTPLRGA